ncbi:hypothetical protein ZIOFF_052082 [Zingiber officinale]|uniref:DCD domain-containing protein n=1 Tax=Zingiber officinale TaxID=94328 RepID=A0A8J5KT38_ZINOF|nr:hypothetical protein ZIOFF_052082 [Zingiber officinale]
MVKVQKLKRRIQEVASLTPSEKIKKKGKKNEENHPKESNPPTSSTADAAVNSVANTSRAVENGKNKEPAAATPVEKSSGFIFMCSRKTKPECFSFQVFGLPGGKKEIVERIKTGAKLFLYDFQLKLLYGVYKATCQGGMNLSPEAFRGAFPAQVKFKVYMDCQPLPEAVFRSAIIENYNKGKFTPELNSKQVRKLLSLFRPINEISQSAPSLPNVSSSTKNVGGHIMSTKYVQDRPHLVRSLNEISQSTPSLPNVSSSTKNVGGHIMSTKYVQDRPHLARSLLDDRYRLDHMPHIAPIPPHLPLEDTFRLDQLPLVTSDLPLENSHRLGHLTHGPPHLPIEDPIRSSHLTHGPHLPIEDPIRSSHLPHVTPMELRYLRQAHANDSYAYSVQAPSIIPATTQHLSKATRACYVDNPTRGERGNIVSNSQSSQCKWCWVLGGGQIVSGSGGRGNWTRNRLAQVVVLAQVLNCQLKSFIGNCKDYILKLATRIDNRPWLVPERIPATEGETLSNPEQRIYERVMNHRVAGYEDPNVPSRVATVETVPVSSRYVFPGTATVYRS